MHRLVRTLQPWTRLTLLALTLLVTGCDASNNNQEPTPTLEPPAPGDGFQMAMSTTVEPGSEAWICSVYPIPITETAPVHSVEFIQNEGMHHMTLSTTGVNGPEIEYGLHDCNVLYEQMMDSFTMIFGSQSTDYGDMILPDGIAASLPPDIDIVHEVHFINTTDEPIELYSVVNAYTIPEDEVVAGIWGGQVRDETIHIPANSQHTEWTRCLMNREVDVLFLASHTHDLGVEFTIAPYDGTTVGDVFYRNTDLHDPMIVQYDPPMPLPVGQGFEYTCTWDNPRDEPIEYGTSTLDEMCNLALVHTPMDILAKCEVVETSDGVLWE